MRRERALGVTPAQEIQPPPRDRARAAGVEVNSVAGDVTKLGAHGVGDGYDLLLDRGCFHGLSDSERESCAAGMTAAAASGAQLLMFAFQPRRGLGPRGISSEELARRLGGEWQIHESRQESGAGLPWWLGDTRPTCYECRRR